MSLKNIEKWSPGYFLLKNFSKLLHLAWYSEIHVKGKENIPVNSPVIFALNHQNALLDALILIFSTRRQPVFLARADIFKKKFISRILYFLKILPVYRIRDGYGSLQNNDKIFLKTIEVLKAGRPLAILPEGTHVALKMLRPLKKGLARIAFSSAEAIKNNDGISIVPVGIDYSNYYSFRNKVVIIFGKPIRVNDFMETFRENNAKGMNELTNAVSGSLKNLIINVSNVENHETIMGLASIQVIGKSRTENENYYHRFLYFKKSVSDLNLFASQSPDAFEELSKMSVEYYQLLENLKLDNNAVRDKKISVFDYVIDLIYLVILFPFYAAGLVFNYLPFKFPGLLTMKMKDIVFHASVKFVILVFLFPLWYILLVVIFFRIFDDIVLTVIFLFGLPLTGLLSFHYSEVFRNKFMSFRYCRLLRKKDERYVKLSELKKEIMNKLGEINS